MKQDGIIVIDGKQVGYTLQCRHCGEHFEIVKGSGKKRGWCQFCKGPVCGLPQCMNHIPVSAKLDYEEAKFTKNIKIILKLEKKYPAISKIVL